MFGDYIPGHLGPAQVDVAANGGTCFGVNPGLLQQLGPAFNFGQLSMESFASGGINQAQFIGLRSQPAIGVVLSQKQPIFGSAGEHSVGFVGAAGDQVVDQHANVGVLPRGHPRRLGRGGSSGIQSRDQPLSGGFFVSRGSVDLSGKEQPRDRFGFQVRPQLRRWAVVVLDCVAVSHDGGVFQTGNAAEHRVLNVSRQAGRDPVDVHFAGLSAFWFQEQLMAGLVSKSNHFVFDRRTVSRAARIDLAAVHRCSIQVRSDQVVYTLVGVRDMAGHLWRADRVIEIAEWLRVIVTGLLFQFRIIDRASVESWRRSGLEAIQRETHSVQRAAESGRGSFARTATGGLRFARVHDRLQERSGR